MTDPVSDGTPEWLDSALNPLARALRAVLAPLDSFLGGLPLEVGRWCAAVLLVAAALGVFLLKRDYVYLGAPDKAAWRDLRFWTLLALLPYVAIYLFLF